MFNEIAISHKPCVGRHILTQRLLQQPEYNKLKKLAAKSIVQWYIKTIDRKARSFFSKKSATSVHYIFNASITV